MFAVALFTESMRHRFGLNPDIRIITSFVASIAETRVTGGEGAKVGFPCREAEALIRAALGEVFLRASNVLEEGFEISPELAAAEDDWFATGMHESPFAMLRAIGSRK
jgi:hypothetical protein